ncbi:putative phage integrase domain protein, partial [Brucella grignonensis]
MNSEDDSRLINKLPSVDKTRATAVFSAHKSTNHRDRPSGRSHSTQAEDDISAAQSAAEPTTAAADCLDSVLPDIGDLVLEMGRADTDPFEGAPSPAPQPASGPQPTSGPGPTVGSQAVSGPGPTFGLPAHPWNFAQRGQPLDRKDRHIATVMAGIRNTHAAPPRQKEAILPEDLLAMLETLDRGTLRGLRDRAMLLLGFAGGLRRSEIVGLDVFRDQTEDSSGWIEFFPDKGILVTLRGKTGWREVEIGRGSS